MKKYLLILICFIILVTISFKETNAFYEDNELSQISKIATQNHIEINSWMMYIKEPIKQFNTMNDLDKTVSALIKSENDYTWSKKTAERDHYKIEGRKESSHLNLEEKILLIIYSQNGQYNLSVTYDIKGKWDEYKWPAIFKSYKQKIENYSTFYTVQGTAKIEQSLYADAFQLLTNFSGKEVESLNEDHFVSLSAFTDRWENKISLGGNEHMNLHIAYRLTSEASNIANVTIGTPIITSEY